MKTFFKTLNIFTISVFLISCGSKDGRKEVEIKPEEYKQPLENVNKMLVKSEDEQINNFIERYNWEMQKTGTGLRYMIYKKGSGVKAERGKIAKINFEVRLITGDVCYSSKDDGAKELLIGKSGEISGIEEGILLLRVGDKAKLIIPSHLAYGLPGDDKKIPKRATLVYDLELTQIK